jgi:hypothetical protein
MFIDTLYLITYRTVPVVPKLLDKFVTVSANLTMVVLVAASFITKNNEIKRSEILEIDTEEVSGCI